MPALPGCFTFGATVDEALANAREAIAVHIKGFVIEGEPIPQEPTAPRLTLLLASVDVAIDAGNVATTSELDIAERSLSVASASP